MTSFSGYRNKLMNDPEFREAYREFAPLVLTMDELRETKRSPVWFETFNGKLYTGWALAYEIQKGMGITGERLGVTQPNGHIMWVKLEDYNKTWRCWTEEPTEQERREVLWEKN